MKTSNFDKLMSRYVLDKTSALETIKIEAMLNARKGKAIHWLSDETEELLFRKISDNTVMQQEVADIMKNLTKLNVGGVRWMKFRGMEIYFSKEAY
ncbi:MAG TPA: hypothetical protein PLJ60_06495 [Chryseolinea sp.]|jgi:hypothetical protein|nr:hypothetical protein [Chryseolinea sp.]